jgi:hypothetical protein
MSSLICNTPPKCDLLCCNDVELTNKKIDFSNVPLKEPQAPSYPNGVSPSKNSSNEKPAEGLNQPSPFPLLDSFIRNQINRGGIQGNILFKEFLKLVGEIRSWLHYPSSQIVVYNIVKNKWCESIQT